MTLPVSSANPTTCVALVSAVSVSESFTDVASQVCCSQFRKSAIVMNDCVGYATVR